MLSRLITKGSSSGATLSFALRSKGETGQPSYLIIHDYSGGVAVHLDNPPPTPSQTLKSNPKHCNLHWFCDFCLQHAENCANTRVLLGAVQQTL